MTHRSGRGLGHDGSTSNCGPLRGGRADCARNSTEAHEGENAPAEAPRGIDSPDGAAGPADGYAGHTLTASGGSPRDTVCPSFHSRVRGKSSTIRCSAPTLTRAS